MSLMAATPEARAGLGLQQPLLDDVPQMRAFLLVRHAEYGYLLLRSFKRKKGEHYQLPGGRVDPGDAVKPENPQDTARRAGARELFEETRIDVRTTLDRLTPLLSNNAFAPYYYFELQLQPSDNHLTAPPPNSGGDVPAANITQPVSGEPFGLILSSEHTGFRFVQDLEEAACLTAKHSGGRNAQFLRRYHQFLMGKQRDKHWQQQHTGGVWDCCRGLWGHS